MQHPLFVESVHALLCMFEFLHSILECYWYTGGTESSVMRQVCADGSLAAPLISLRSRVHCALTGFGPSPAEWRARLFPRLLECRLPESFRSAREYNIINSLTNSRMPSICLIVLLPTRLGAFRSLLRILLRITFHHIELLESPLRRFSRSDNL